MDTVPHVAKTRRNVPRRIARERPGARPYQSQWPRVLCPTNVYFGQQCALKIRRALPFFLCVLRASVFLDARLTGSESLSHDYSDSTS